MEATHSAVEWLLLLAIGGVAGLLGQAARTVVGLKKLNDKAEENHTDFSTVFSAARLFVSLVIGFVAGAFAAIVLQPALATISMTQIVGLMGAGYTGADFIEGFMNRVLPQEPVTEPKPEVKVEKVVYVSGATPAPAGDDTVG
jgi:hypothetical protein